MKVPPSPFERQNGQANARSYIFLIDSERKKQRYTKIVYLPVYWGLGQQAPAISCLYAIMSTLTIRVAPSYSSRTAFEYPYIQVLNRQTSPSATLNDLPCTAHRCVVGRGVSHQISPRKDPSWLVSSPNSNYTRLAYAHAHASARRCLASRRFPPPDRRLALRLSIR